MLLRYCILVGHLLLWWIVPIALLMALLSNARGQAQARTFGDQRLEFTPDKRAFWAWPIIVAYLGYIAAIQWNYLRLDPIDVIETIGFTIVAVMIVVGFPGTIRVSAAGLEQIYWLWRNRRIDWADIVEINTGKKGRTVTITATDGTKIVHSRNLADRTRFLAELKRHCGENLPQDFPREPITES